MRDARGEGAGGAGEEGQRGEGEGLEAGRGLESRARRDVDGFAICSPSHDCALWAVVT